MDGHVHRLAVAVWHLHVRRLPVLAAVCCCCVSVCTLRLSYFGHKWYMSKVDVPEDHDSEFDDRITANAAVTFSSKYWRRIASIAACVVMCVAQVCSRALCRRKFCL